MLYKAWRKEAEALTGEARRKRIEELDRDFAAKEPKALRDWVGPSSEWAHVWDAYWMLQGSRAFVSLGMGGAFRGEIPYEAKSRWLRDHGYFENREGVQVLGEEAEFILDLLRGMEAEAAKFENQSREGAVDDES